MSDAFRRAIWAREKQEPKPVRKPQSVIGEPKRRDQHAHRPKRASGRSTVVRVLVDGREEVVDRKLSEAEAEKVAGERRDRMTDADVGAGTDYRARHYR